MVYETIMYFVVPHLQSDWILISFLPTLLLGGTFMVSLISLEHKERHERYLKTFRREIRKAIREENCFLCKGLCRRDHD